MTANETEYKGAKKKTKIFEHIGSCIKLQLVLNDCVQSFVDNLTETKDPTKRQHSETIIIIARPIWVLRQWAVCVEMSCHWQQGKGKQQKMKKNTQNFIYMFYKRTDLVMQIWTFTTRRLNSTWTCTMCLHFNGVAIVELKCSRVQYLCILFISP